MLIGMADLTNVEDIKYPTAKCQAACPLCSKTQHMITSAVSASIDEVVLHLEKHDIARAISHANMLLEVLDNVPASTRELIDDGTLAELKEGIHDGIRKANEEPQSDLIEVFRAVRIAWLAHRPIGSRKILM